MFPFATLYQFFSCLIWNEENAVVIKKREFISKLKKKTEIRFWFHFHFEEKKAISFDAYITFFFAAYFPMNSPYSIFFYSINAYGCLLVSFFVIVAVVVVVHVVCF